MTNLKFFFAEIGPGSAHIPPKPNLYLRFQTFMGTLKMPKSLFVSNSARKVLKMAIKSNRLGNAAGIFGIFYSQWDYQMVNISKILKFLT